MSDQLKQAVADLVIRATQAAEAAGKFAAEQLPDVAQQYVMYVSITSWLWVTVGLLLIFAPPVFAWRFAAKQGGDAGDCLFTAGMVSAITGTLGVIAVASNLSTAVMATFAPKVLLIKWAAELVR